jgi:DNA topoisomerase-3
LTKAAVAANSKAESQINTGAIAAKVAKKSAPPAKKAAAKSASKAPRKTAASGGSVPSAALAGVIGPEPITRQQAIKKLWDYIKANNLQDPTDKRVIVADAKLQAVLGQPRVGMFALAGVVGGHLN